MAGHVTSKTAGSAPKIVPFIHSTVITRDEESVKQSKKSKGKTAIYQREAIP